MDFKDKLIKNCLIGSFIINLITLLVLALFVWSYFWSDYTYINNSNTNTNTITQKEGE